MVCHQKPFENLEGQCQLEELLFHDLFHSLEKSWHADSIHKEKFLQQQSQLPCEELIEKNWIEILYI